MLNCYICFFCYYRVCKLWYEITRHPMFWRKIASGVSRPQSGAALKLAKMLPSSVTYIELNFERTDEIWFLNLKEFSSILRARCPNLHVLILRRVRLTDYMSSDQKTADLRKMLENIRIFAVHQAGFMEYIDLNLKPSDISKMEVLDFRRCRPTFINQFTNWSLPNLKKIRLSECRMNEIDLEKILFLVVRKLEVLDLESTQANLNVFGIIRRNGHNLRELYICDTNLHGRDLIFSDTENALENLKIICLRNCNLESSSIISLINSCKSLQHVYIGGLEKNNEYLECQSDKVHYNFASRHCNHCAKINYICE